ncbi:hypothetical protein [Streptomyces sp. NPDC053755]|uniref:hypothetical protein n=1 Tax=Streptomyces sp. NPDC053755 TaxID=3155815 RepID=UPI00341FAB07
MLRTARASAAFAALLGVVLGLLASGGGARTEPGEAVGAAAVVAVGAGTTAPGCDQGPSADGSARPVTPPRPTGFGDLLPALTRARPADGGWCAEQDARDLPSGPAPPELVPPSPVELSILRV